MTRLEKRLMVARAWADKAMGDLETAKESIGNPRIPAWVVGFHLQQALEKTWKGRLVLRGRRPPPVHDLRALLQMLEAEPEASQIEVISTLQPFAVEERYPLLSPRQADRGPLAQVMPLVEAEVQALVEEMRGPRSPGE